MKILVVSQYFWPENFRINDLVVELQERGHEITVLTGWPNYPDGFIYSDFRKQPKEYSNYNGIKVLRVPLLPRGKSSINLVANYLCFVLSASLLGPIKLAGIKVDRIFVFEPSPVTVGLPAIVIKFLKKAPIAFWVLDLWPETLTAVGVVKSKFLIKWINALVSFIYKHSDLLLAQSRSFVNNLNNYCDTHKKVKYFPAWAEDIFVQKNIKPAIEIPPASSDAFSLMFAGNIGDAQDFNSILVAAEILRERKDVRWLIVGDGRMADWVKEESRLRGLDEKFIMLGRYSLNRMPSFYAAADALLVSLKAKDIFSMTIPGKLQPYLASGKAIIGMLNGEGASVIRESGAGYVCNAGDGPGLAKIIADMASLSHQRRGEMGESGRIFYKKHFDKKVLIDRLESWLIAMD